MFSCFSQSKFKDVIMTCKPKMTYLYYHIIFYHFHYFLHLFTHKWTFHQYIPQPRIMASLRSLPKHTVSEGLPLIILHKIRASLLHTISYPLPALFFILYYFIL